MLGFGFGGEIRTVSVSEPDPMSEVRSLTLAVRTNPLPLPNSQSVVDRPGAVVRAADRAALGVAPEQPVDLEGAERRAGALPLEGLAQQLAAPDRGSANFDLAGVAGRDEDLLVNCRCQ